MISPETSIDTFKELLDNAVLSWGLIACGGAQVSKLIFELVVKKQWRPAVLFETGGMPSSHSSLVTGTAAGVGLELGFSHPAFALATTVAFVVMYDASGIRRAAGLTAERVNELIENNPNLLNKLPLKENLGHKRMEVLIGSLFGPTIALPGIIFIGSPLDFCELLGLFSG